MEAASRIDRVAHRANEPVVAGQGRRHIEPAGQRPSGHVQRIEMQGVLQFTKNGTRTSCFMEVFHVAVTNGLQIDQLPAFRPRSR